MSKESETPEQLSVLRRAIVEIQSLRAEIDALERSRDPSIALIGLGCRFPGADGPEEFWRLLRSGAEAIRDVPPERWDLAALSTMGAWRSAEASTSQQPMSLSLDSRAGSSGAIIVPVMLFPVVSMAW